MVMLTPRLLKRGLEWFAILSFAVIIGILLYTSRDLGFFVRAMLNLRAQWLLLAVALASLDWIGGGFRLWVVTRHIHPGVRLGGMILAGGLNNWASHLTPSQTGGGPMMIWAMKQYGVPYPEATTAALVTFITTIIFFAVAGPLAIFLGAGESLRQHGIILGITVLDLFRGSLGFFVGLGVLILAVLVFPGRVRDWLKALARTLGRRRPTLGRRVESWRDGIDRAHQCLVAFFQGTGWVALLGGVLLTAAAFANRLLAGYVVLRALGIEALFLDVLLLQTMITCLLYFAPTPGGAGMAEIVGAAVMQIYVPRELIPSYTLVWRMTVSYLTVAFGSVVFWLLLRRRADRAELAGSVSDVALQ